MKARTAATIAGSIAATLIAGLLILFILVQTGAYNVSALVGHSAIGRWALETMMHNSVEARAGQEAPERFTPEMIAAGGGEYRAMCQQCHGGPGVDRAEWARGMLPQPPELAHAATEWSAAEIQWIVSNGIKMSGMPAFGPTHDEATIWNIAAFVKQLPAMTPEDYAAIPESHGSASGGDAGGGGHGGHSHQEGN